MFRNYFIIFSICSSNWLLSRYNCYRRK